MESKLSRCVCLLFTILILELSSETEARQNDKRRKDKSNVSASPYPRNNICSINDRDSKVHCYCESTKSSKNASKAECWVFNGGIPPDDPVWPNFSTQPNLRELSFNVRADGGLNFIPTQAIKYLRELQTFNIKYASIFSVTADSFANITSLKEITLSANDIFSINKFAFSHLTNLTILTLDDNKINELVSDAFVNLPSLHKLYLTNNNITLVHDGAFKHLINLVDLEMDNNSISALSRDSFNGLANLKRLDLRNNKLYKLGDFTFAELWNLQELLLDGNDLQFINERTFDGLSQLWMLSLSDNKLVNLISGLFEGVRGLKHIDLHSNNMRTMTQANIRPVLDNLKDANSFFNIEGNILSCDCRLMWMYRFRNDTKSESTKSSLKKVTCLLDPVLQKQLSYDPFVPANGIGLSKPYEIINENSMDDTNKKDLYFETAHQLGPNDGIYDDKAFGQSQHDNYHKYAKNGREKPLFDVPAQMLPCSQELLDPTESTHWHPNQGEIKDFRNLNSGASVQACLLVSVFCYYLPSALIGNLRF